MFFSLQNAHFICASLATWCQGQLTKKSDAFPQSKWRFSFDQHATLFHPAIKTCLWK